MTRNEKLLVGLDLERARGIEVGALATPVVPPLTPNVFYVDHADTPSLREKYKNDPSVDLANLVDVNGVWGEKTLAEAAAAVAPVDFLVASHVIEHVPDLITWLQEVASVLKPHGEVRLAIPDRRFTFDLLRAETQIADVLNGYLVRARIPQPRQVIDHVANVVIVDCAQAWDGSLDMESLVKHHQPKEAEGMAREVLQKGTYYDVHCWVFTPWSFADLMEALAEGGYISLKCARFFDTERNTFEFFVHLQPCDDTAAIARSWKAMRSELQKARATEATQLQAAASRRLAGIDRLRADMQLVGGEHELALRRIADLEKIVNELEHGMLEIRQSRSWRITAPLRAIASGLRRRNG